MAAVRTDRLAHQTLQRRSSSSNPMSQGRSDQPCTRRSQPTSQSQHLSGRARPTCASHSPACRCRALHAGGAELRSGFRCTADHRHTSRQCTLLPKNSPTLSCMTHHRAAVAAVGAPASEVELAVEELAVRSLCHQMYSLGWSQPCSSLFSSGDSNLRHRCSSWPSLRRTSRALPTHRSLRERSTAGCSE